MLEELELFKSILGELTGAGLWAMGAYITYSLVKVIITWWALLYVVIKVINTVSDHTKCEISKDELEILEEKMKSLRVTIDNKCREINRNKEMYDDKIENTNKKYNALKLKFEEKEKRLLAKLEEKTDGNE